MRAAYCISGYTGGLAGRNVDRDPADYRFCHSINYQNVILPNRCDVFFHTWSTSEESKLVDLYRPISYICEDQIYPDTWPDAKTNAREFRWTSRWYGFNRAVSLMKAHEQANGFIYDWVFVTRFDIVFRKHLKFSRLDNGKFYLAHYNGEGGVIKGRGPIIDEGYSPAYESRGYTFQRGGPYGKDCIYRPSYDFCGWRHLYARNKVSDLWFLSNSALMSKFSEIYFELPSLGTSHPHLVAYSHLNEMANGKIDDLVRPYLHRYWDYELYRILYWMEYFTKGWWK